jgi:hypothetical protein
MKTKLFSTIIFLLFLSVTIQAQDGFMFGVLGGVNFQNINGKDEDGSKIEYDLKTGFHAGINTIIDIAPEFYFQPGLLFSTKGCKLNNASKLNISYLEVPLNLLYRGQLGKGNMLLGFGPFLGFGIDAKIKDNSGSSIDVDFEDDLNRVDAGANIFVGYELASRIFFQLNTQLGLLKVNNDDQQESEMAWKNTGFGLSAGYRF